MLKKIMTLKVTFATFVQWKKHEKNKTKQKNKHIYTNHFIIFYFIQINKDLYRPPLSCNDMS